MHDPLEAISLFEAARSSSPPLGPRSLFALRGIFDVTLHGKAIMSKGTSMRKGTAKTEKVAMNGPTELVRPSVR